MFFEFKNYSYFETENEVFKIQFTRDKSDFYGQRCDVTLDVKWGVKMVRNKKLN